MALTLQHPAPQRQRLKRAAVVAPLVLVVAILAAGAIVVRSSHAALSPDATALARVSLPLEGRVEAVSAVSGPHAQPVAVAWEGRRLVPTQTVSAGEPVTVQVTVARPGWLSWVTGAREHLSLTVRAPSAALTAHYVTLAPGAPLRVGFSAPVSVVWTGTSPGALRGHRLAAPEREVTVAHAGSAGEVFVAGAPQPWESARATQVSWFPAGGRASVVASPAPGSGISPDTPIRLTFSVPVAQALRGARPTLAPASPGAWRQIGPHTLVFAPRGLGYGLDTPVTVALPAGINVVDGTPAGGASTASWRVPAGSTTRLQQLLAGLGYLPLRFTPDRGPVARTPSAQEQAAERAPVGSFAWRYASVPAALRGDWAPGHAGELTRGAVMAFENDHGLATDGVAGPQVWRALLSAVIAGDRSSFGYTFVTVSVARQRLSLWHNGQTVVTTPVNTGAAGTPTQPGTFAVYEHLRVTTMSGTNPNGTHYHDPNIQFVSYFNGGDALHAFTRAQYGFPQSLGCVEMPLAPAGRVWPYTPIGTIVHVA